MNKIHISTELIRLEILDPITRKFRDLVKQQLSEYMDNQKDKFAQITLVIKKGAKTVLRKSRIIDVRSEVSKYLQ